MSGDTYEVGDVGQDGIVQQGTGNHLTVNNFPSPAGAAGRHVINIEHSSIGSLHLSGVDGESDADRITPSLLREVRDAGDPRSALRALTLDLFLAAAQPRAMAGPSDAIDLVWTDVQGGGIATCVFEVDDPEHGGQVTWRNVRSHLRQQVMRIDEMPELATYWWCTTATVTPEARGRLVREIQAFFADLGGRVDRADLAVIQVKVLDWSDYRSALRADPKVRFRWVPWLRPDGLVPIDRGTEVTVDGGFRTYLQPARLPFHSLREYVAGTDFPDESQMLDQVAGPVRGLIITGPGGVGKTRLNLEIGRLADRNGWVVLQAVGRMQADMPSQLAKSLPSGVRVLLLVDYLELQPDFVSMVDRLNQLAATRELTIRFVANCRTNHYTSVSEMLAHERVRLPALTEDVPWYQRYRRSTVQHILRMGGLEDVGSATQLCRDVPALAVFLLHLSRRSQKPELDALLGEPTFGQWLHRRVRYSFDRKIDRDLAVLAALLPIPFRPPEELQGPRFGELVRLMAADGWLDRTRPDDGRPGRWEMVHDILADEIVRAHMDGLQPMVGAFIDDVLDVAGRTDCVRSAILSLERLCEQPALRDVNWLEFIERHLDAKVDAWRAARPALLHTSLLSPVECLELLGRHEDFWEDVRSEPFYHGCLGWLAWHLKRRDLVLTEEQRNLFDRLVGQAINTAEESNYLLTKALELDDTLVADVYRGWLDRHAAEFQAQYLIAAALRSGHGPEALRPYVERWLSRHDHRERASFVISRWLATGGDREVVRGHLERWLVDNHAGEGAGHVMLAWLEAGGGSDVLSPYLERWLRTNLDRQDLAVQVLSTWMKGGGDLDAVRFLTGLARSGGHETAARMIRIWLRGGGSTGPVTQLLQSLPPATSGLWHAITAWLEANGKLHTVQPAMEQWLAAHPDDPSASFVMVAWLRHHGEPAVVRRRLMEWLEVNSRWQSADRAINAWLLATREHSFVKPFVHRWLEANAECGDADFLLKAWVTAGGDIAEVQELVDRWLTLHSAEARASFLLVAIMATPIHLDSSWRHVRTWLTAHGEEEVAGLVLTQWLRRGGAPTRVTHYIVHWLEIHSETERADMVFHAWLSRARQFEAVAPFIDRWLATSRKGVVSFPRRNGTRAMPTGTDVVAPVGQRTKPDADTPAAPRAQPVDSLSTDTRQESTSEAPEPVHADPPYIAQAPPEPATDHACTERPAEPPVGQRTEPDADTPVALPAQSVDAQSAELRKESASEAPAPVEADSPDGPSVSSDVATLIEIIEMWQAGRSVNQIARQAHIPIRVVKRRLDRATAFGVRRRERLSPSELAALVRKLSSDKAPDA